MKELLQRALEDKIKFLEKVSSLALNYGQVRNYIGLNPIKGHRIITNGYKDFIRVEFFDKDKKIIEIVKDIKILDIKENYYEMQRIDRDNEKIEEEREKIKQIFIQGYEKGHLDAVESGNYCPNESAEDYINGE